MERIKNCATTVKVMEMKKTILPMAFSVGLVPLRIMAKIRTGRVSLKPLTNQEIMNSSKERVKVNKAAATIPGRDWGGEPSPVFANGWRQDLCCLFHAFRNRIKPGINNDHRQRRAKQVADPDCKSDLGILRREKRSAGPAQQHQGTARGDIIPSRYIFFQRNLAWRRP